MSIILLALLLAAGTAWGQDSTWGRRDSTIGIIQPAFSLAQWKPTNLIAVVAPSGKRFTLNFSGDSLVSSGELLPDSAAWVFIDYVGRYWWSETRLLRDSLEQCRGRDK